MSTRIEIPYSELKRLIGVAAPHASTDRLVPVFMQVRLRSHHGMIEATATDRYTAVWVAGTSAVPTEFEFGLTVKDWKHCLSLFRPARGSDVKLAITIDGGHVSIERIEGTLFGPSDVRVDYEVVEGAYPKIEHIRDDMADPEKRSTGPVPFLPRNLARFPLDDHMAIIPGVPGKPSWIVGSDYCIAIMGQRSRPGAVDEWIGLWAPEPEVTP